MRVLSDYFHLEAVLSFDSCLLYLHCEDLHSDNSRKLHV